MKRGRRRIALLLLAAAAATTTATAAAANSAPPLADDVAETRIVPDEEEGRVRRSGTTTGESSASSERRRHRANGSLRREPPPWRHDPHSHDSSFPFWSPSELRHRRAGDEEEEGGVAFRHPVPHRRGGGGGRGNGTVEGGEERRIGRTAGGNETDAAAESEGPSAVGSIASDGGEAAAMTGEAATDDSVRSGETEREEGEATTEEISGGEQTGGGGTTTDGEEPETAEEEAEVPEMTDKEEAEKKEPSQGETVTKEPSEEDGEKKVVMVDYASKSAGALILQSSDNFQGTSNLLQSDRDKYAIVPCQEDAKFVVVGLSEDILVKHVVLANYERYSSHTKDFNVAGSTDMASWVDLGTYTAKPGNGKQTFDLTEPFWARYLKFRFLNHYGDEHYCTISQISVHGSTMLQGFHEQWGEDQEEDVNGEEESATTDQTNDSAESEVIVTDDSQTASDTDLLSEKGDEETPETSLYEHCTTMLDYVCPEESMFERTMLLFSTANESECMDLFNNGNALSSASFCVYSSQSSKSSPRTLPKLGLGVTSHSSHNKSGEGGAPLVASGRHASDTKLGYVLSDVIPVVQKIKSLVRGGTVGVPNQKEEKGDEPELSSAGAEEDVSPVTEEAVETTQKSNEQVSGEEESSKDTKKQMPDSVPTEEKVTATKPVARKEEQVIKKTESHASEAAAAATAQQDSLQETSLALARVLQRLPNAKCLEALDFAKFKTGFLNTRRSTGNSEKAPAGNPMEPIFKKLTDEIKALQTNIALHDQFAKESILCYQRVMLDLLLEMETLREDHDLRISRLENDIKAGAWIAGWITSLQRAILPVLFGLFSGLVSSLTSPFSATHLWWALAVSLFLIALRGLTVRITVERGSSTTSSPSKTNEKEDESGSLPTLLEAKESQETTKADFASTLDILKQPPVRGEESQQTTSKMERPDPPELIDEVVDEETSEPKMTDEIPSNAEAVSSTDEESGELSDSERTVPKAAE